MVLKYLFLFSILRLNFLAGFQRSSEIYIRYLHYMIPNERNYIDPCQYWINNEFKAAICNAIVEEIKWERTDYNDFYYSFATLIRMEPQCTLVTITIEGNNYPQIVMPCFGVHDPVRTNITIDDYYDKLFISLGTDDSSVMLYEKEKYPAAPNLLYTFPAKEAADPIDIYTLIAEYEIDFDLLGNVDLSRYDLPIDWRWSYVEGKEAELIDLCEMVPLRGTKKFEDKLKRLDKEEFLQLCIELFNRPKYYTNNFYINIPKHKRMVDKPASETHYMLYTSFPDYNNGQQLPRQVYPCYGGRQSYYISSGPRNFESRTSVMIYLYHSQGSLLQPMELIENIDLRTIRPPED